MCLRSAASSRPVQPAMTSCATPGSGSSFFILRDVVARHQPVDDAVELGPRGLAVGVVADDERRAGIEALVLQVAAGELGADQVPGELEELHALDRARLRRLEEGGELLG